MESSGPPPEDALTEDASFEGFLRQLAEVPEAEIPRAIAGAELTAGTVIDNKLRIDGVLGRGGMGVVYLAHHLQLSRRVAVKLTNGRRDGTARLLREAKALASIEHDNIVTVYDVGTIGESVYIAMEFLDDGTAGSWLATSPRAPREIVRLYIAAGRGLAAAHARGLVHRDFKPENVFVGSDGRVRVGDFGLARVATIEAVQVRGADPTTTARRDGTGSAEAVPPHEAALTAPSTIVGTPAYMAPEQLSGRVADARSDQFSFCVSLGEALFGHRPGPGDSPTSMLATADASAENETASAVPLHIRRALARGLSTEPARRFDSMAELLEELQRDPGATLRRTGLAVLALTATALGTWLLLPGADDPCARADTLLEGTWDDGVRADLGEAFARTKLAYAGDAWARTEVAISAYADRWTAAHREVCEATRVRGTQSDELMDLRVACLAGLKRELAASLALMRHADAVIVEHAADAVAALPLTARCANNAALRNTAPIPHEHTEAVAALRGRLAQARARINAGNLADGERLAGAAVEDADAIGVAVLRGEAHRVAQHAASQLKHWEAAAGHAQEGLAAAIAASDDRTAAELAVALVNIDGYHRKTVGAERWLPLAAAYVERLGSPKELMAASLRNRGLVAREASRFDEAMEDFERALVLVEGDSGPQLIRIRGALAVATQGAGDLQAAEALLAENLAAAQRVFGPTHPAVAEALNNHGTTLWRLGRVRAARERFDQALAIRIDAFGEPSAAVGQTLINLAVLADSQGEPSEAVSLLQRARPGAELDEDPAMLLLVMSNLAAAYTKLNRDREAAMLLEQTISLGEGSVGRSHLTVVRARYNLATIERRHDRADAALTLTAEALDAYNHGDSDEPLVGGLLLALQGALLLDEGNARDALPYLQDAVTTLDRVPDMAIPYRFEPLRDAGAALVDLGRPDEALESLHAAREHITPALSDIKRSQLDLNFARAHLALGDHDAAHASALAARSLTAETDTEARAEIDAVLRRAASRR